MSSLRPSIPFVWPDSRVSAGLTAYKAWPPFDEVALAAKSIFGVVSAPDISTVKWLDGYIAGSERTKLRIVVSVYPTCRTTAEDLANLLMLEQRHGKRVGFRLFPEMEVLDRSSNMLCLCGQDGGAMMMVGPTENMGFAKSSRSQANVVCPANSLTLHQYRKWFDYLWGISAPLRADTIASIPRLVLPQGSEEAHRRWEAFREACFGDELQAAAPGRVAIDPDTGEVTEVDKSGNPVSSATDEIDVPKLDALAEAITKLFELGKLVAIEKGTRIPPLKAPVKPEWFGVQSFRQTGMVEAQTAMKVAPFGDLLIRRIDRLCKVSGDLLPKHSFALADGARWIPNAAISLFEQAFTKANDEAKELLFGAIGDDLNSFLDKQRDRIRADAQKMYATFHPGQTIPEASVDSIIGEFKIRLGKTKVAKLIPTVSYSSVTFNPLQTTEWSDPWGMAFQFLKGVASFPREAMTNQYFWRGVATDEDKLVSAMNIAGDYIVRDYDTRTAKKIAIQELELIRALDTTTANPKEKTAALWTLLATGAQEQIQALVEAEAQKQRLALEEAEKASKSSMKSPAVGGAEKAVGTVLGD